MEEKHRDMLTSKHVFLVENLDMPLLIDHMLQTRLLSDDDKDNLEVNHFYSTLFST